MDVKKIFSLHLSSNAKTFVMLNVDAREEPEEEFCFKPIKRSELQDKANVLASYLLKLFLPTSSEETTNFLPVYQISSTSSRTLTDLEAHNHSQNYLGCAPAKIQPFFAQNFAQNLGGLLFLNVLFSGSLKEKSLGIATSPRTDNPFFVQKLSSFWSDYFKPEHPFFIFDENLTQNISTLMQSLASTQLPWWHATGIFHQKHLFFYECFDVAIRVYLTPVEFIKAIADSILDMYEESAKFIHYLQNKINNFKQQFFRVLSQLPAAQQQGWKDMLQKHGLSNYEQYRLELSNFKMHKSSTLHPYIFMQTQEAMLVQAMNLGIPDLYQPRFCDPLKTVLKQEHRSAIAAYLFKQETLHQQLLDPNHGLWPSLENLASKIKASFKPLALTIPAQLLIHCIVYQKNNLAKLIIDNIVGIEAPVPIRTLWPLVSFSPTHEQWLTHSLLFIALQSKNNDIANYLRQKQAKLLIDEKESTLLIQTSSENSSHLVTCSIHKKRRRERAYSYHETIPNQQSFEYS